MNPREQIINFLLQTCDQKDQEIAQLKTRIAELEKAAASQIPEDLLATGK